MSDRKVIVYIASSLDGYIAKPNDDLSFLNAVHKEGEDYGYARFESGIDTVILGRRTYDWVMGQVSEFPHKDKETYIITRKQKPSEGKLQYYSGDLATLIGELKVEEGKDIFCEGGAEIVNLLLRQKLIDEIILSVIPVLLGNGTRLFQTGFPEQILSLISSKSFDTGLVQLHYAINP